MENRNSLKTIVVKVGSNVLTDTRGFLDQERLGHITSQIRELRNQGVEVVLVSSGAVAAGRSMVQAMEKADLVSKRQLWASVGQVRLINTYESLFSSYGIHCAQVLVTREDFRDREHYRNLQNCFRSLLQHRVIPIVNENDVVSITELMFTDNDELAGLIAALLNADALFILTNVNGIYNGKPGLPGSEVIREVLPGQTEVAESITAEKSNFGRGGMLTKYNIARKVARSGIRVVIANGKEERILQRIMQGDFTGTTFVSSRKASNLKKWIAHSEGFAKGAIQINEGAKQALTSEKATSLLPVGIINITGSFKKGDLIRILDENNRPVAIGKAQYASEKAEELKGLKHQKPLVHYDYLYLYS